MTRLRDERCVGVIVTGDQGQVIGGVSVSTLVHELSLREATAS